SFATYAGGGGAAGRPSGSARRAGPPPAARVDGPPAVREVVLGSADHPVPRPRRARDARGGRAVVPRLRTEDGRADLRDRGRRSARREPGPAQNRPGPSEVR